MDKILRIVLLIISFTYPATGIVFRVKSKNNIASLHRIPTERPPTRPIYPTTSSTTTTPELNQSPVISKRKYINEDYFHPSDDSITDPWQTSYPPVRTSILEGSHQPPNPLLQLLWSHNLGNFHKFSSPFGQPRVVMPLYWGLSGYGLYSYAAGNDLHNNQPRGSYKHVREY